MANLALAAAAVEQLQGATEEGRSVALPVLRALLGNVQKDASEGSRGSTMERSGMGCSS